MAVLFSAVSGVDPISSNNHDGSMLHIVRTHPDIDRVVLFFTKEFKDVFDADRKSKLFCERNGAYVDRYTYAIHKVRENIVVSEPILTDITDPELIDGLDVLAEKLLETNNQLSNCEKLYVNVSSGTSQMQTVLTLMANNIGADIVQVVTPQKRSNRPLESSADVCDRSASNLDNGILHSERIKPQQLNFINKYVVEHKILGLVKGFQYCEAWELFKNNKELISEQVGFLLEYAYLKTQLRFREAEKISGDTIAKIDFHECKSEKQRNILEFLMMMKVHLAKDELYEFIIKMTPLLVEIVRIPFEIEFPYEKISKTPSKRERGTINREIFEDNYPGLLERLPDKLNKAIDEAGFFTFNKMCACLRLVDKYRDFSQRMQPLRKIEEKFRNVMAHNIATNISNRDLVLVAPYEDVDGLFKTIVWGVQKIIGNTYGYDLTSLNTYDILNEEIYQIFNNHKIILLRKNEENLMDFLTLKKRAKEIGQFFIGEDEEKEFTFHRTKGRYGYIEYGEEYIPAELPEEYNKLGLEQKVIPVSVLELGEEAGKLICEYSLCSLLGKSVIFYDSKMGTSKDKNCLGHIYGKCGNKIEAKIITKNKPEVREYCSRKVGKTFAAKVVEFNNLEQTVYVEPINCNIDANTEKTYVAPPVNRKVEKEEKDYNETGNKEKVNNQKINNKKINSTKCERKIKKSNSNIGSRLSQDQKDLLSVMLEQLDKNL